MPFIFVKMGALKKNPQKWKPEPAFDDLMRQVLLVKPDKKKPAKRKKK
jgi:hypothetical protein